MALKPLDIICHLNQDFFFQSQITKQSQVDVHIAVLVHQDLLNNFLQLRVGHGADISDTLNGREGSLDQLLQLVAFVDVQLYQMEVVFQTLNFLSNAANLIVQLLTGDQIIGIHIHILLALALQLGKLVPQLFFKDLVFIFGLVNSIEFVDSMLDNVLLGCKYSGKICLQHLYQFILINGNSIRTTVRTLSVMSRANPSYIGVLIGSHSAAERPATVFALNECRE